MSAPATQLRGNEIIRDLTDEQCLEVMAGCPHADKIIIKIKREHGGRGKGRRVTIGLAKGERTLVEPCCTVEDVREIATRHLLGYRLVAGPFIEGEEEMRDRCEADFKSFERLRVTTKAGDLVWRAAR